MFKYNFQGTQMLLGELRRATEIIVFYRFVAAVVDIADI